MEEKDPNKENEGSNPSDNDPQKKDENEAFGLPEVNYEPINREEPFAGGTAFNPKNMNEKKEHNAGQTNYAPVIVGILLLLVVIGAASYFFFFNEPEPEPAESVYSEYVPYEENNSKPEEITVDNNGFAEDTTSFESFPETPAETVKGSYSTISGRTGRSYIVIGSFIDEDLALDEAKELAEKGLSTQLIPPYNNVKYYRLAVQDHPSFAEAAMQLENLKQTYGENIWILKY